MTRIIMYVWAVCATVALVAGVVYTSSVSREWDVERSGLQMKINDFQNNLSEGEEEVVVEKEVEAPPVREHIVRDFQYGSCAQVNGLEDAERAYLEANGYLFDIPTPYPVNAHLQETCITELGDQMLLLSIGGMPYGNGSTDARFMYRAADEEWALYDFEKSHQIHGCGVRNIQFKTIDDETPPLPVGSAFVRKAVDIDTVHIACGYGDAGYASETVFGFDKSEDVFGPVYACDSSLRYISNPFDASSTMFDEVMEKTCELSDIKK